jgi:hypothetical protein
MPPENPRRQRRFVSDETAQLGIKSKQFTVAMNQRYLRKLSNLSCDSPPHPGGEKGEPSSEIAFALLRKVLLRKY